MKLVQPNPIRLQAALAGALLVILAALSAAPAEAAFPGTPGQIVYPLTNSGESGTTGGLRLHGPRLSQKPHSLTNEPGDESPAVSAEPSLSASAPRCSSPLPYGPPERSASPAFLRCSSPH